MAQPKKKFVIGVPTVRRARAYLDRTVASLVTGMSDLNRTQSRIVILDAEPEAGANPVINELKQTWPDLVASGFITVLRRESPLELESDVLSLKERWQRKQALDCVELFQRCSTLGEYYLHVEDDIIASSGFLAAVERRLESHVARGSNWRILSFYNSYKMRDDDSYSETRLNRHYFGLIGQLLRSQDLPDLARYICAHYNRAPVDVLVGWFVLKSGGWVYAHSPSLFQHVGVISSLQGRTQMWTAPEFEEGRVARLGREIVGLRDAIIYQPRSVGAFLRLKLGFHPRSAAIINEGRIPH